MKLSPTISGLLIGTTTAAGGAAFLGGIANPLVQFACLIVLFMTGVALGYRCASKAG